MSQKHLQYKTFLGLSLVIVLFIGILHFVDPGPFRPYFGTLNPLILIIVIALLGVLSWSLLLSHSWFSVFDPENRKGLLIAPLLAIPFGVVIILVDLQGIFPADLNVPFPASLLFYPAMGYVVEVLFHIVPLTLLLFTLSALPQTLTFEKIIWPCIIFVTLLEPIFQTVLGLENGLPLWETVYVGIHIFLINLVQLAIFKRFDFISMYAFRLTYYLIWHIAWGMLRLELLF